MFTCPRRIWPLLKNSALVMYTWFVLYFCPNPWQGVFNNLMSSFKYNRDQVCSILFNDNLPRVHIFHTTMCKGPCKNAYGVVNMCKWHQEQLQVSLLSPSIPPHTHCLLRHWRCVHIKWPIPRQNCPLNASYARQLRTLQLCVSEVGM